MNAHQASLQRWIAQSLVFTAALCIHQATLAEPAQSPLLSRSANVAPNLVLMFDDSVSMLQQVLYQESSSAAWGGNKPALGGLGVTPITGSDLYARCSPQINQIYYNPKLLYLPPYTNAGQRMAAASPPAQWAGVVCKDGNNNPILYRYQGNGPLWNQTHTLDLLSSYTPITIQPSIASYPKSATRTDCKANTCTYAEELQNFSNWYQWYRLRVDMARHALIEAFIDLQPNFRLGWGRINTLGIISSDPNNPANINGELEEGVSLFDNNKRSKLINFLTGITKDNLVNFTPNRYALDTVGKYFQRMDADGPWGSTPTPSSVGISTVQDGSTVSTEPKSKFASCRRANAMLITDGYYGDTPPAVGEVDNITLPKITSPKGATYQYIPTNPYKQNSVSSFADVAMKYWATDLNSSLINNITPSGNDPAFWQHLNFWGITLGVDGKLPRNANTLANLRAGTQEWPVPYTTPGQIDDMWHATLNARGDMLSAGNPAQLKAAVNSMVGQILKTSSSQAGISANTLSLSSNTLKFVPSYTTGEWSGNISAYQLDAKNGNTATLIWHAETRDPTNGLETDNTLYPNLSVAFGPGRKAADRKIHVGTPYKATGSAVGFNYSDMNTAGLIASMVPAYSGQAIDQTLIDYLRGDRSEEGPASTRQYRVRAALLGDVVNSTPTLVKQAIDYGYANLPAGTPGISDYASFLSSKAGRKEGVLFFGANDGMAHGLAEKDGREVFAFVPRAVLPNIATLADPNYSHRYFVDGPMTQGDFYSSSLSWKNVVIGSAGAGAKSVFAFDVTNPLTMGAANVLWEINSSAAAYAELGYVLSDVQIGLMRNGQWAAIFGNGYSSQSGSALLFVVNMDTGALIASFDTKAGPDNGLGGVRLVKNSNNVVIGAYAGDLLGNLWKFDLSDTNAANWGFGFGTNNAPKPLFIAATTGMQPVPQPITSAPFVQIHPQGGYMVVVGTGKFFEDADLTNTTSQTTYGIYDKTAFGATRPDPGISQVSGVTKLVEQTILNNGPTDLLNTQDFFTITANPIDWSQKEGWYFKLPFTGQRVMSPIESLLGRIIRVDTIAPSDPDADPCTSSTSATGYNFIVDALTGGSPQAAILDTNRDGSVDSNDLSGISGYSTSADGRDVALARSETSTATSKDLLILNSNKAAILVKLDLCKLGMSACTKTIAKRSWRQLYLR